MRCFPVTLFVFASAVLALGIPGDTRNRQTEVIREFKQRIDRYMKMRDAVERKVPPLKKNATPVEIDAHEEGLAAALRQARIGARAGEIFFPEIESIVRIIIAEETKGRSGASSRAAIREGNPKEEGGPPIKLAVNARYPESAPLSVVPPELLLKLPELPKGLEYRFVGPHLILRDTGASLIVDYVLNAVASPAARLDRSRSPEHP
jgi:hypothetical protein